MCVCVSVSVSLSVCVYVVCAYFARVCACVCAENERRNRGQTDQVRARVRPPKSENPYTPSITHTQVLLTMYISKSGAEEGRKKTKVCARVCLCVYSCMRVRAGGCLVILRACAWMGAYAWSDAYDCMFRPHSRVDV